MENIDMDIKSLLLRNMELAFLPNNNTPQYFNIRYPENTKSGDSQDKGSFNPSSAKGVEINEDLNKIDLIKNEIRDILIKNSVNEYVVTRDRNDINTILIIHRTKGESMEIFHCRHCAMEFDDEIQLSSHLRMHYFI
jgi:hypothetical protein